MKQIIIIKPKSLTANDKRKLTKAGHIVIECENPDDIKSLTFESAPIDLCKNDYFMAALKGANEGYNSRDLFVKELYKRLTEKSIQEANKPVKP